MTLVKVDLDNHWRTSSHISKAFAQAAVNRAAQQLGPGGIVGLIRYDSPTEVDPRWALFERNVPYDKISTGNGLYFPEKHILVVHGQEVQTDRGEDLLIIGTSPDSRILHRQPLEKIMDAADAQKALKIAAAPFHDKGIGNYLLSHPEQAARFDAIEVFSGEAAADFIYLFSEANERAEELYRRLRVQHSHLMRFVGSDGHSLREIGRTWAEIHLHANYADFASCPEPLIESIREAYDYASFAEKFNKNPARVGAYRHAADLSLLIAAKKILGWNPNTKTAPFFEHLGLHV